jgi:hypothetical protein
VYGIIVALTLPPTRFVVLLTAGLLMQAGGGASAAG